MSPEKMPILLRGSGSSPNTWFLWVHPNSISIGFIRFRRACVVTTQKNSRRDTQTLRPRYISDNRRFACYALDRDAAQYAYIMTALHVGHSVGPWVAGPDTVGPRCRAACLGLCEYRSRFLLARRRVDRQQTCRSPADIIAVSVMWVQRGVRSRWSAAARPSVTSAAWTDVGRRHTAASHDVNVNVTTGHTHRTTARQHGTRHKAWLINASAYWLLSAFKAQESMTPLKLDRYQCALSDIVFSISAGRLVLATVNLKTNIENF